MGTLIGCDREARVFERLHPAQCVHLAIDMQPFFMPALLELAAPLENRVVQVAADLKKAGVPTIWMAWPQYRLNRCPAEANKIRFARAAHEILDHRHRFIEGVPGDDLTAMKFSCNGFTNPTLPRLISQKLKRDTVIVSGVFLKDCVAETIWGGLQYRGKPLRFIALADHIGEQVRTTDSETGAVTRHARIPHGDMGAMARHSFNYMEKQRDIRCVSSARLGIATGGEILERLCPAPRPEHALPQRKAAINPI